MLETDFESADRNARLGFSPEVVDAVLDGDGRSVETAGDGAMAALVPYMEYAWLSDGGSDGAPTSLLMPIRSSSSSMSPHVRSVLLTCEARLLIWWVSPTAPPLKATARLFHPPLTTTLLSLSLDLSLSLIALNLLPPPSLLLSRRSADRFSFSFVFSDLSARRCRRSSSASSSLFWRFRSKSAAAF